MGFSPIYLLQKDKAIHLKTNSRFPGSSRAKQLWHQKFLAIKHFPASKTCNIQQSKQRFFLLLKFPKQKRMFPLRFKALTSGNNREYTDHFNPTFLSSPQSEESRFLNTVWTCFHDTGKD